MFNFEQTLYNRKYVATIHVYVLPFIIMYHLLPLLLASSLSAATLSDSLFIEGYYSQEGTSFSRRKVENFLLTQDTSMALADAAKGLRLSAWAIGTTMWCINTGIAAYQIKQFLDAVEREEPISANLDNLTIPLAIGGEITSFVQNRLRYRSDYLIHKAVLAYNTDRCEKLGLDSCLDLRIKKGQEGRYMQDRLFMPEHVLYAVLRENDGSRAFANWSVVCRETANQALGIGMLFLALAAVGYLDEGPVDRRARDTQLGLGIGITSFGIINAIVSAITRGAAIKEYNWSISPPVRPAVR
jgi:hypothetical protein